MLEIPQLELFKLNQYRKGIKENTVRRRVWNLKHLARDCGDWTLPEVDALFLKLLQEGKKATYVNSLVDSVRTYADFAGIDELKRYKDFKEKIPVKSTLSDEEIEAFLSLPCKQRHVVSKYGKPFTRAAHPKHYEKWTMFFYLLAFTGARPNEIAKLTVNDILWGQDCISIKDDKIGQNRLVPIAKNLTERLKSYLAGLDDAFLFKSGNSSGVVNSEGWGHSFHERLDRLGIKRTGLTPYSFRHTFITSMLNEDVNIFKVQKIVGHRRLETTNRYTHMTTKDITEAIKKHPIVKKNTTPTEVLKNMKELINAFGLDQDNRFEYEFTDTGNGIKLHLSLKE